MATAGEDFGGKPRQWLDAAGIDTTLTKQIPGKFCASFFCSTDTENNQIASFYTGAMADAGQLSFRSAKDAAWRSSRRTIQARWCNAPTNAARSASRSSSSRSQCARMEGSAARRHTGATIVIVSDYELRTTAAEDRHG